MVRLPPVGSIAYRLEQEGFREAPEGLNVAYYVSRYYPNAIVRRSRGFVKFSVASKKNLEEDLCVVATGSVAAPGQKALDEIVDLSLVEPEEDWCEEAVLLHRIIKEYLAEA